MPKMHQNTFGGRNRGGPTFKGRDISIDWPQGGTTSLKYKAQRERRVPSSSHSFDREQTQEILCYLGTQKGANLCQKSTKIRSRPGKSKYRRISV